MAIDLYMENKITEADKVLKEMQDTGFRPTLSVYEAKLAALCRESEVDEAVKVIEVEMVKAHCVPTVKLYNIVLRGLCDGGKSALAVGYLRKMVKQVGCVPDKETYDILVDGLCLEGKFIEANKVLEEMLIKSYWPCVDTFNILIRGLCSVGRQYEGVMLLEEMINQDINFWGSVYATHFAIPYLKKTKGKIIVISSAAKWFPMPRLGLYSATKAAVTSFYETLRVEIGKEVGITIVD
ncbi:hypothetical protein G4B88_008521 [Cannabis sativa]|uniref:Pentatricopeptide repeat-containing protein n=1 Tax=Cannabis sativa TaxID=3483 RepID=A0A7J6EET6_CANSA|nr:hypothetical protein G4B88_008521 [Cannabis sativa]